MAVTRRPPTVVIGFGEAFAAIETAWSLQRAGFGVAVLLREGSRAASRTVRGVERIRVPAPETDLAACVGAIQRHLDASHVAAFLPLDDAALLVSQHLALGDTVLVGPDEQGASLALDKEAQLAAARRAGLPVPETTVLPDVSELRLGGAPVMVKPADAVRVVDGRLVRPSGRVVATHAEGEAARAEMASGRVLVQPLLSGVGEGLFGFSDGGGPRDWSAHRRIRMVNPQGSASSACESIPVDPDLRERAAALLRSVRWRGLFMFELLRDNDGVPWFMELNGRAWGSMALARRRGLEYPAWAVQAALGHPLEPAVSTAPVHRLARHAGRELLHLGFVIRGPRSTALASGWPRPGASLRAVLSVSRRDRLYNWNPRQPWVVGVDTVQALADQVGAGRRRR